MNIEYHQLFSTVLRAGLRRGELVALQFGDINFGTEDDPPVGSSSSNTITFAENTLRPKAGNRAGSTCRDLRRALLEVRDAWLLKAFLKGKADITDELVFRGPDGGILDPDNLYHRYFVPVLTKAGIRKIRLHDLRHTFGSQLIESGASIVYVKEQMGHSSIQVTVDTYGHLIPRANASFVDRMSMHTWNQRKKLRRNGAQTRPPSNHAKKQKPRFHCKLLI